MHEHPHSEGKDESDAPSQARWRIALVGFALLGALLLISEHRLHIPFGNLWIILPLFACIGLHSLMHGGHGGHGGHGARPPEPDAEKSADRGKDVQP